MINAKLVWTIAIVAMVAMLACNLLYPYAMIRYAIIIGFCAIVIIKRDFVQELLRK